MSVITESFTGLKVEPDLDVDDGSNQDFDGWYCIKTDPWPCPICNEVVHYATTNHKIIVFPEKDHPNLLKLARSCQKVGRNPKIVEYERSMGPCISWYNFEQMEHR